MWISPLSVLQKITRTFIIWATVTTAVARRDITLTMTSVQRCSSSCSTLECLYPIHSTATRPNIRPQVIRHSSLSDIVVRAVYNFCTLYVAVRLGLLLVQKQHKNNTCDTHRVHWRQASWTCGSRTVVLATDGHTALPNIGNVKGDNTYMFLTPQTIRPT